MHYNPRQLTLVQIDTKFDNTGFLHERSTGQTFLINVPLLQAGPLPYILIDIVTRERMRVCSLGLAGTDQELTRDQNLPEPFAKALRGVRGQILAGAMSIDLSDPPFHLRPAEGQRFMVFLAGYLLEYPFIYLLSPTMEQSTIDMALQNVHLELLQLISTQDNRYAQLPTRCKPIRAEEANTESAYCRPAVFHSVCKNGRGMSVIWSRIVEQCCRGQAKVGELSAGNDLSSTSTVWHCDSL